jgi:hypothetical protein
VNITAFGNITYTLTGNIYDEIVIERDNIVVDGADYATEGTDARGSFGIDLTGRSNVTIKNMQNKGFNFGVSLGFSSSNAIYPNSFVDNTWQVYSSGSVNAWDDGYPSGGNYWSDYNGTDSHSGLLQNETGSDWIGDSPYAINQNNTDRYPLMQPFVSEAEEMHIAYRNLLLRFAETRSQLEALNSQLEKLTDEIASAQSQLDSLNETVSTLLTDIHLLNARMRVPKLVCEVPYASCFGWFVSVYGCLSCE